MAMDEGQKDVEAYLARIRRTIAESKTLVSQAELRIAETDRMLEKQGLTREQVMAMRFSDAQMDAVNEELRRRGMDPLEKWTAADGGSPYGGPQAAKTDAADRPPDAAGPRPADAELENRQRKFGMMMKPFQI